MEELEALRKRNADREKAYGLIWVAVKELKLSYHNGYIYGVNNRVSPNIVT